MAEENMLVAVNTYLKSGIHIGTKFKTQHMKDFIYKARPDGLFVLNLQKIDERVGIAAKFLAQFEPEEILVASRRENGWKPVKLFGKLTGCKVFAGRYPPGLLTNTALENFMEAKVVFVADPWPDRNVVEDAMRVGIPVVALCDTNNQTNNIDLVIPCNNKGKKSLGLLYWLIAREFLRAKGILKSNEDPKETVEDFTEE